MRKDLEDSKKLSLFDRFTAVVKQVINGAAAAQAKVHASDSSGQTVHHLQGPALVLRLQHEPSYHYQMKREQKWKQLFGGRAECSMNLV